MTDYESPSTLTPTPLSVYTHPLAIKTCRFILGYNISVFYAFNTSCTNGNRNDYSTMHLKSGPRSVDDVIVS